MEITSLNEEGRHELQLLGRFDANWADRVGQAIEMAIQSGYHQVDLEFARVDYLSSAGIRVLLKYHKQLKAVGGALKVLQPTPGVLEVLQLSGIAGMLIGPSEPGGAPAASAAALPESAGGGSPCSMRCERANAPPVRGLVSPSAAFASDVHLPITTLPSSTASRTMA